MPDFCLMCNHSFAFVDVDYADSFVGPIEWRRYKILSFCFFFCFFPSVSLFVCPEFFSGATSRIFLIFCMKLSDGAKPGFCLKNLVLGCLSRNGQKWAHRMGPKRGFHVYQKVMYVFFLFLVCSNSSIKI